KKLYRHCHELHQGLPHFLYECVPCLRISHCVVQSIMCMLCLSQLLKAVSHILFQSLSEPCQRCWTKAERVFAYIGMKVIIHIAPIKSSIIAYKAYRLTISNINNPIEEGIHSLFRCQKRKGIIPTLHGNFQGVRVILRSGKFFQLHVKVFRHILDANCSERNHTIQWWTWASRLNVNAEMN